MRWVALLVVEQIRTIAEYIMLMQAACTAITIVAIVYWSDR